MTCTSVGEFESPPSPADDAGKAGGCIPPLLILSKSRPEVKNKKRKGQTVYMLHGATVYFGADFFDSRPVHVSTNVYAGWTPFRFSNLQCIRIVRRPVYIVNKFENSNLGGVSFEGTFPSHTNLIAW